MLAFAQTCFGFPKAHPVAAGNFFGQQASLLAPHSPIMAQQSTPLEQQGSSLGQQFSLAQQGPPLRRQGPPVPLQTPTGQPVQTRQMQRGCPARTDGSVVRTGSLVMAKTYGFKQFWPAKVSFDCLACVLMCRQTVQHTICKTSVRCCAISLGLPVTCLLLLSISKQRYCCSQLS